MSDIETYINEPAAEAAERRAEAAFGEALREWLIAETTHGREYDYVTLFLAYYSVVSRVASEYSVQICRPGRLLELQAHHRHLLAMCLEYHFSKAEEEHNNGERKVS